MHELSIVIGLFGIMEEELKEAGGKRVTEVHLKIGNLSGVVPEFIEDAFHAYSKGTFAENAKLRLEEVQANECHKPQPISAMPISQPQTHQYERSRYQPENSFNGHRFTPPRPFHASKTGWTR